MKVSIIIPVYNHEKYVAEAIQSALDQTHDVEVIVVNDGSTDDSLAVAASFGNRITIVDQKNMGLSSARNAGVLAANGEFILPLDSDDRVDPHYIEKTLPLMEDPQVAVVTTHVKYFGRYQHTWRILEEPKLEILVKRNLLVCTALIRRAVLEEIGGWNPAMDQGYEDWNLWIDIAKRGWKFKIVRELLFFYRVKETSMATEARKNHDHILKQMHALHPDLYAELSVKEHGELLFPGQIPGKPETKFLRIGGRLWPIPTKTK